MITRNGINGMPCVVCGMLVPATGKRGRPKTICVACETTRDAGISVVPHDDPRAKAAEPKEPSLFTEGRA